MVFGKKMLWYADVLAYIVRWSPLAAALVVGMFVRLVSIKSSYALINELWFSSFAKSLSRKECLVFPRLAARASRSKILSADVMLSLSSSLEINLIALLCCTISMSFALYSRLGSQTATCSTCGQHRSIYANNFAFSGALNNVRLIIPDCCFALLILV